MWHCMDCEFYTADTPSFEHHLLASHSGRIVDELMAQAVKDSMEIAWLEKLWSLTA